MPYIITMTKKYYERTASGKSWQTKPIKTETGQLTDEQYRNTVSEDTQRFFRRLGCSETAEKSYTCAGYNITRLTSCNPDRTEKHVREFSFNWQERGQ